MRSPQTRLCQLSLFLLAAALGITTSTANAQITLDPAEPQAGEPFQVRIEGAWRDSCTPTDPRLRIADRLLEVTFRLSGSVCLLAGTSYTAVISVPALDAGTYELRARIFDFDGPKPFFQQTLSVQGSPGGIVSISPTFDTPVGNRVIVLRGSFPCETNDCAAPEVFFGERAAEAVERISESEIHAVAPAQNARVVDVIVQGTSYRRVRPSGFTYIGRTGSTSA